MLASNCRKSSGVKEIDNDSYQRGNCKCGGSPAWRISPLFPIWGKSVCQTIFLMYLLTVVNQRTRLIHQIPRGNNISPRWRICATFYLLFISCCYYFPLITFHLPPRCRFPQMGFRYRAVKMAFIYHQLFVRYNAFSHLVETFFVYFLPGKHYHNTKKEAFKTCHHISLPTCHRKNINNLNWQDSM